ncbi:MAG: hypothetical protein NXI32_25275 [bacterium]|nr:hypothetical protein [bacterium]
MSDTDDLLLALEPVARALQSVGVRFYVGGSVASSFHGALRSTMDVDLVCELLETDVPQFLDEIGTDYYASEPAILEAIRRKSCFNLIHLPTSFKVDVFISRQRSFDLQALSRAQQGSLGGSPGFALPIASPEDVIVIKLEWYRLGGEVSERQWGDVSRLIRLLGDTADIHYLREAASSVGVADLLARLLEE